MAYSLQFDGMLHTLSDENPRNGGFLGYGWLLIRDDTEIAYGFGLFAQKQTVSSNLAEYLALIEALEASLDLRIGNEHIEIRGDAKCVIDQMTGAASISSQPTQRLYKRARKLADRFNHLTWGWVPRAKNKPADKLSRRGLHQLYIKPNAYEMALDRLNSHSPDCNGFISVLDLRVYNPLNYC
jgi:ribonuclease HI